MINTQPTTEWNKILKEKKDRMFLSDLITYGSTDESV